MRIKLVNKKRYRSVNSVNLTPNKHYNQVHWALPEPIGDKATMRFIA